MTSDLGRGHCPGCFLLRLRHRLRCFGSCLTCGRPRDRTRLSAGEPVLLSPAAKARVGQAAPQWVNTWPLLPTPSPPPSGSPALLRCPVGPGWRPLLSCPLGFPGLGRALSGGSSQQKLPFLRGTPEGRDAAPRPRPLPTAYGRSRDTLPPKEHVALSETLLVVT